MMWEIFINISGFLQITMVAIQEINKIIIDGATLDMISHGNQAIVSLGKPFPGDTGAERRGNWANSEKGAYSSALVTLENGQETGRKMLDPYAQSLAINDNGETFIAAYRDIKWIGSEICSIGAAEQLASLCKIESDLVPSMAFANGELYAAVQTSFTGPIALWNEESFVGKIKEGEFKPVAKVAERVNRDGLEVTCLAPYNNGFLVGLAREGGGRLIYLNEKNVIEKSSDQPRGVWGIDVDKQNNIYVAYGNMDKNSAIGDLLVIKDFEKKSPQTIGQLHFSDQAALDVSVVQDGTIYTLLSDTADGKRNDVLSVMKMD